MEQRNNKHPATREHPWLIQNTAMANAQSWLNVLTSQPLIFWSPVVLALKSHLWAEVMAQKVRGLPQKHEN